MKLLGRRNVNGMPEARMSASASVCSRISGGGSSQSAPIEDCRTMRDTPAAPRASSTRRASSTWPRTQGVIM
jgi:hypothetical protein